MSQPTDAATGEEQPQRLQKQLRLRDVFAISIGAMFSSGFFLLPGIASAEAGPAVAVAYLLAGVLVLPAMLSAAELSTAMPRAGGAYYFVDRSMGPMVGTIGGIGNWLTLVAKSAFALVGMSAYLAIFFDVPIRPVAVGLTIAFVLLNIGGVRQATHLQVVLVTLIMLVLAYFLVAGLIHVFAGGVDAGVGERFTPFLPFGVEGVIATTGLVFVSYSGLTKVASVAEEVQNPNRNIPLGMLLSLVTATTTYVVGVFIMVMLVDPDVLREDFTPVATAAEQYLPQPIGLLLVVAAAIAAFAASSNASILSSARYPLAMARDRLLWRRFASLGRFETPTSALIATGLLMIVTIVALDVAGIASAASAFILLTFGLLNLSVVVMRESGIQAYDPGFRAPFYPWLQLFGMLVSVVLIAEIGLFTAFLVLVVVVGCVVWYVVYGRHRARRDGAIYHIFQRLGQRRDVGLDREMLGILQEQGVRDEDRFAEVVARAKVVELPAGASFDDAVREASVRLADRLDIDAEELADRFAADTPLAAAPVARGAALPHALLSDVERPEMVIVRSHSGVAHSAGADGEGPVYALLFLVGDKSRAGQVLRILAQVAAHLDNDAFLRGWHVARNEQELKEVLLAEEQFLSLRLVEGTPTEAFIGRPLRDLAFPEGVLVALVRRDSRTIVPRGSTVLHSGDRLTVIGDRNEVRDLQQRYQTSRSR